MCQILPASPTDSSIGGREATALLLRVHVVPRAFLFSPINAAGCPTLDEGPAFRDFTDFPKGIRLGDLEGSRVTMLQYVDELQQEPELPGRWSDYRSRSQDVDLRVIERIERRCITSRR